MMYNVGPASKTPVADDPRAPPASRLVLLDQRDLHAARAVRRGE
jgi:hypothetical protein